MEEKSMLLEWREVFELMMGRGEAHDIPIVRKRVIVEGHSSRPQWMIIWLHVIPCCIVLHHSTV